MSARNQDRFQVRFDWGLDGAAAVGAGAHVLVWADALPTPGAPVAPLDHAGVIAATVGSRAAVAQWILDRQADLGDRLMIAVVAAGTDDGRFCVEDLLAAGAVIDALGALGIDATSPEAAAAGSAFAGLSNAAQHLLSASVTGREIGAEAVAAAKPANLATEARILKEFSLPS